MECYVIVRSAKKIAFVPWNRFIFIQSRHANWGQTVSTGSESNLCYVLGVPINFHFDPRFDFSRRF